MRKGLILVLFAVAVVAAIPIPSSAIASYVCQDQAPVGVDLVVVGAGPTCSFEVTCPSSAANDCRLEISGSAAGIGTVGVLIQTAGAAISSGCYGAAGCATPHTIGNIHPGDTHTVYGQWTGAVGVNPVPSSLPAVAGLASIRVNALLV